MPQCVNCRNTAQVNTITTAIPIRISMPKFVRGLPSGVRLSGLQPIYITGYTNRRSQNIVGRVPFMALSLYNLWTSSSYSELRNVPGVFKDIFEEVHLLRAITSGVVGSYIYSYKGGCFT